MAKIVAPPSALIAEGIIIGAILLDINKFEKSEGYIVSDDVFYDNRNKLLWNKIKGICTHVT